MRPGVRKTSSVLLLGGGGQQLAYGGCFVDVVTSAYHIFHLCGEALDDELGARKLARGALSVVQLALFNSSIII